MAQFNPSTTWRSTSRRGEEPFRGSLRGDGTGRAAVDALHAAAKVVAAFPSQEGDPLPIWDPGLAARLLRL